MAWYFSGTADLTLTAHAALVFPDSDWTFGGWVQSDDPTPYCKIYSNGIYGATNSITVGDLSKDRFEFRLRGAGSVVDLVQPQNGWLDTDWHQFTVTRSGDLFTLYWDGTSADTETDSGLGEVDVGGDILVGGYQPGGQHLVGRLAEWGKWSRCLSVGQVEALAKGYAPPCFPGMDLYFPMWGGVYKENASGVTVTNNGAAAGDHKSGLIYPSRPKIFISGGAPPAAIAPTSHLYGSLVGPLGGPI